MPPPLPVLRGFQAMLTCQLPVAGVSHLQGVLKQSQDPKSTPSCSPSSACPPPADHFVPREPPTAGEQPSGCLVI